MIKEPRRFSREFKLAALARMEAGIPVWTGQWTPDQVQDQVRGDDEVRRIGGVRNLTPSPAPAPSNATPNSTVTPDRVRGDESAENSRYAHSIAQAPRSELAVERETHIIDASGIVSPELQNLEGPP